MSEAQQAELRQDVRLKYGTLITDEGTWELMEFAYMSGMNRAARCNDTAPVAPIGDDEVNKLVLSTLSKLNSRFLWDTMTRESGPYDIDKVNYQFTLFVSTLLAAVAAQGEK